jgi:superfamily II DNA or RNA helicase
MMPGAGRRDISIHSFFLPDLLYTLELIRKDPSSRTPQSGIKKVIKLLIENTWLKRMFDKHPELLDRTALRKFLWKPLQHQTDFYTVFEQSVQSMDLRGYLLAAKAGSGKTFTQLSTAEMLNADVAILIVPKNSINRVWEATIEEQFGGKVEYWSVLQNRPIEEGYRYYIFNYENLGMALSLVESSTALRRKKVFIGVDECQNFNDIKSQRTQALIRLHHIVPPENRMSIWASGTPFKALGVEIIPFLKANDPLFTKPVEQQFVKIFGRTSQRALSILSNRINKISYKVPDEVVTGGRAPIEETVYVKVDKPQRFTLSAIKSEMRTFIADRLEYYSKHTKEYIRVYDEALSVYEKSLTDPNEKKRFVDYKRDVKRIRAEVEGRMIGDDLKALIAKANNYEKVILATLQNIDPSLKKKFKKAKGVYKYVQLVVQGEALGGVLGKRREEAIAELAANLDYVKYISESEKKTLIFSNHVASIRVAEAMTREAGYTPLMVYGDTNKNLPKIIDRFYKDKMANPLIATIQSLSTAVPIVCANTVLFLNQPFRGHNKEQAIARVARLGQDTQVYVFNFYIDTGDEPNVTTRSEEILKWSMEQVAIIMGEAESPPETNALLMNAYYGNTSFQKIVSGLITRIKSLLK